MRVGARRPEHRKRLTRTAISEAAWELFAAKGFDAVPAAEIARAADVGTGTVLDYFPTKESILFGSAEELVAELRAGMQSRMPAVGGVAAFREWHEDRVAALLDPRSGDRTRTLLRIVTTSPALQAYEHTVDQLCQRALASVLYSGQVEDVTHRLLAGQMVALHRSLLEFGHGLLLNRISHTQAERRMKQATERGFNLLSEQGRAWGRS